MKRFVYPLLFIPTIALAQEPESSVMSTVSNLFVWASIIGIAYFIYWNNKKTKEKEAERQRQYQEYVRQLESEYRNSLKGTDKAKALELGRLYFSHIREGGNLTIYDEQALTNDLSTMKTL